jgi:putative transposase
MLDIKFDARQLPFSIDKDVVVTMDKLGRFWMHCPFKKEVPDNQGRPVSWTALDPGNRVFLTGYDPSGSAYKLGAYASERVMRLCYYLDDLISRTDVLEAAINKKWSAKKKKKFRQKVSRMRKAQIRLRQKVKNLVAEMHWKCADWLCKRYTDIIIPTFATQEMVCKQGGRQIARKTARGLMTMSHFTFRQRLEHKAKFTGTRIYVREEDYTSKTCTNCGFIHDGLGSKDVFSCPRCGLVICRDANGSRNIFLKNTIITFE